MYCLILFNKEITRNKPEMEKVGYPSESTRHIYQHIVPPTYGLYNGCIGQHSVIFGEQLGGYPPKGTLGHVPLKITLNDVGSP